MYDLFDDPTLDMLMNKEEQTRIGVNNADVDHVRPPAQKLMRILGAYAELQAENEKLKNMSMRFMCEHCGKWLDVTVREIVEQALKG